MADYTWLDLMRACRASGFEYGKGLITAFAVSAAEDSARNLKAVYTNPDQWHSRDRGPWQINDHWHPEVTDEEAFDLRISTDEAYRISQQGSSFTPWSGYNNGRYRAFMDLGYAVYALDEALHDVQDLKNQLDEADLVIADTQQRLDVAMQTIADEKAEVAALSAKIVKAQADLA